MPLLAAAAAVLAATRAVAQTTIRITNPWGDTPTVCESFTITWEGNQGPVDITLQYGREVKANINVQYYELAKNVAGNSWTWDKFRLPADTHFRIMVSESGSTQRGASGLGFVSPYYRFGTSDCVNDPGAPPIQTWPTPSSTCPPCPSCSPCSTACPPPPEIPPCPSCSPCSTENPTAPPTPTTCTTKTKTKTKSKKN